MSGVSITFFNTDDKSSQVLTLEEVANHLDEYEGFYWCDIEDKDVDALETVLTTLNITAVWGDYFNKPDVLPHLKDTPTAISFYLYDIIAAERHLDSTKDITEMEHQPLLLILGKRCVITYHQRRVELIDYVQHDAHANFQLSGKSPAFIVFLLVQHCLYNYARLNLANDNFLDLIELGLLTGKKYEYMKKISISGYNILTLKKMNANLHIILLMLVTKRSYVVTEEARSSLHHMLIDTLGIRESIDSSRDLLDSIIASTQANEAHKTGEIVQVLTIVSAIFLPLTLVAGIYGMNFEFMPELHWKYGYLYALGLMVLVALGLLGILQYYGWLYTKPKESKEPKTRRRRIKSHKK